MDEHTCLDLNNKYILITTKAILVLFVFLSGYCLGKNELVGQKSIKVFWKKRILRIYPLFVFSILLLFLVFKYSGIKYVSNIKQLVLSLLGITCIYPPPSTLWFVIMLFDFYFLTPLILKKY